MNTTARTCRTGSIVTPDFLERVDDVLQMAKYRKTLMALKMAKWEIDRYSNDQAR